MWLNILKEKSISEIIGVFAGHLLSELARTITSGPNFSNLAKPASNWLKKVAAVSVVLAEYLIRLSSVIAWNTKVL